MDDQSETMSKPGCLAAVCLLFGGFMLLISIVAASVFWYHVGPAREVE